MAKLISQINTHADAPGLGVKREGEDPTGPTSVWFTVEELLSTHAALFKGDQGDPGPAGPPGPLTLGQVLALLG